MNTEFIKTLLKSDHNIDVIKVYQYGSRVYGTNKADSDYDFIAITEQEPEQVNYTWDNIDVTVYSIKTFQDRIDRHEISALECLWIDGDTDNLFKFNIDKETLRDSISAKVSHCWVKGKKKLTVGSVEPKALDRYIGLKSIFHAFRICEYGTQIAVHGKIVDYSATNYVWKAISNFSNESWDTIYNSYKIELNNKMSNFRIHCPKNI